MSNQQAPQPNNDNEADDETTSDDWRTFIRGNESEEWKTFFKGMDLTDVPLDLLRSMRVHLDDETEHSFPIEEWLERGLEAEDIAVIIMEWFDENNDRVVNSDFIINLDKVKSEVKPKTDSVLKDLK